MKSIVIFDLFFWRRSCSKVEIIFYSKLLIQKRLWHTIKRPNSSALPHSTNKPKYHQSGSGCGIICRVVTSDTRGPRFEPSRQQFFNYLSLSTYLNLVILLRNTFGLFFFISSECTYFVVWARILLSVPCSCSWQKSLTAIKSSVHVFKL